MSLSGSGTYKETPDSSSSSSSCNRHPWFAPQPATDTPITQSQLLIRNTLTTGFGGSGGSDNTNDAGKDGSGATATVVSGGKEGLVPFVPHQSRTVKWYTCGPTVYDSSHVGHARTYLSFDIMRRIMTDYFHYNVLYQVNTTDIDDKIILRARQGEIMRVLGESVARGVTFAATGAENGDKVDTTTSDEFLPSIVTLPQLIEMCRTSLQFVKSESDQNKSSIEKSLAEAISENNSRSRTEQEGLLDQWKVKRQNLEGDEKRVLNVIQECEALLSSLSTSSTDEQKNEYLGKLNTLSLQLLQTAKSPLSIHLDSLHGPRITSHSIFNSHARKYEREFMQDMEMLGIREPDVLTRVTEYIPQIIDFINTLVEKGLAYRGKSGSVYLSLEDFVKNGGRYRKLSPAGGSSGSGGSGGAKAGGDGENEQSNGENGGSGVATTSAAEMAEGEGSLSTSLPSEKRNPNDFALWKASKPGEPSYPSPFGAGRPGWHIECSVVAGDILGRTIDIHSGGEDLKFPHHDNELAQSEAYYGCGEGGMAGCGGGCGGQWVNYFTHTGHLHIEGLKMSKSLKNFITIRQALENNTARQLRIMFLLQAWDQPMNYSDQTIDDARSKENTFKSFFREVEALGRRDYLSEEVGWRMDGEAEKGENGVKGEGDRKLAESYLNARQTVHESLLENFNTKEAMGALLKLINEANAYMRKDSDKVSILLLKAIATYVTQILKVFGVVGGSDDFGFGMSSGGGTLKGEGADTSDGTTSTPYIEAMVTFREKVRNAALEAVKGSDGADPQSAIKSILQICDQLRDATLPPLGVRLEDRPNGTMWNLEDPATMLREMAEKASKEREIQISKLEKQLVARNKELEKITSSMIPPSELFRTDECKKEYSEWDEQGVPTKLSNGESVSGGQMKKRKKAMEKQEKAYKDLMDKSGGDPKGMLEGVEREVEEIKKRLKELEV